MTSFFYKERFEHRIQITSLFMEYVTEKLSNDKSANLYDLIKEALVKCGLVEKKPTTSQIVEVVTRLSQLSSQPQEEKGSVKSCGPGKRFAGYLLDWATNLDSVGLCLFVADYDYARARQLYCEVDQEVLVAIAHDKLKIEFERARVGFEAALFGFGGSYKSTPKDGDAEFDLTSDNAGAEVMLKQLGF